MSDCNVCVVRNRAICSALDSSEINALETISRRQALAAGDTLIWEGDDSILLANVVSGTLKLSSFTADGFEQIVGVVYPADFIGQPFGGATRYSVTALTDARVCVFSRADFDRLARQSPMLEQKLLEKTLEELDRTRRWMLLLGRKSASEKLATFLLDQSVRMAEPGCDAAAVRPVDRFELGFSRRQIADVLGLTIETVSRQFTRLTGLGIVALPTAREVVILDRAGLEARAG